LEEDLRLLLPTQACGIIKVIILAVEFLVTMALQIAVVVLIVLI
jgi:hypothetical protein